MLQTVLGTAFVPFTLALGLLFGLLAIEVVALLLGGSLMAGEAPDVDITPEIADLQASFDLSPDAEPDLGALMEASTELDAALAAPASAPSAGLLGLGRVPFGIWLASALLGFGGGGMALQAVASGLLGAPLPLLAAVPAAVFAGLAFARGFGAVFAAAVPRTETTATRAQFMGGLRGVVTQGTARSGSAAEVRVRDRHGNLHFLRCEPFRNADVIPQGTEVLLLRERLPGDRWGLRIVPIS